MSNILDARGWACPKPVIETRKVLQDKNSVTVIVDNKAARENVSRLAEKLRCHCHVEEKSDGIYIHIEHTELKTPAHEQEAKIGPAADLRYNKRILLITADVIGKGSDELGDILMRAFMHTLLEIEPQPETIIFMNNGAKLTISGSPVLEDLQTLANKGVEILVCGTCLNYFNLTDKIAVGEISNAYDIAEALLQAGKVVNL